MLNRIDASLDRIVHSIESHGMRGDLVTLSVRFIDDRAQFVESECRNIIEHAIIAETILRSE